MAGPGLFAIVGRKAGSLPAYNYSDALAQAGSKGKVWTRSELDTFLSDPAKAVPGTAMPVNVADKMERAALIDYLASLTGKVTAAAAPTVATAATNSGAWIEDAPGKLHHLTVADLPALARLRLQALGVTQIYGNDGSAPWGTVSNPSRFFSHRRDAGVGGNGFGTTGRMAACIWLE